MPTAVFGLLCLGSLWSRRPLIYRFAARVMGADTPRGRTSRAYVATPDSAMPSGSSLVWRMAYLAEAAARVIIVETTRQRPR